MDPADALRDGRAHGLLAGAHPRAGRRPGRRRCAVARETEVVRSTVDGYVATVDATGIGLAAWRLGAGRARKEDPVSDAAGVLLPCAPATGYGPAICSTNCGPTMPPASRRLSPTRAAVTVTAAPVAGPPLILERIG